MYKVYAPKRCTANYTPHLGGMCNMPTKPVYKVARNYCLQGQALRRKAAVMKQMLD